MNTEQDRARLREELKVLRAKKEKFMDEQEQDLLSEIAALTPVVVSNDTPNPSTAGEPPLNTKVNTEPISSVDSKVNTEPISSVDSKVNKERAEGFSLWLCNLINTNNTTVYVAGDFLELQKQGGYSCAIAQISCALSRSAKLKRIDKIGARKYCSKTFKYVTPTGEEVKYPPMLTILRDKFKANPGEKMLWLELLEHTVINNPTCKGKRGSLQSELNTLFTYGEIKREALKETSGFYYWFDPKDTTMKVQEITEQSVNATQLPTQQSLI